MPDGKAVGDVKLKANLGPGFHFRLPWPVHDVHIFDNRIQSSEWTFEETGTKEGKPILIKVFVTWKISDALKFFNSFSGDLAKANEVLEGKVRSAQNAVIGKYAFNNLVTTNAEDLKLDAIEVDMKPILRPTRYWPRPGRRRSRLAAKPRPRPPSTTRCSSRTPSWPISCSTARRWRGCSRKTPR